MARCPYSSDLLLCQEGGTCIEEHMICDGNDDCSNGSDENYISATYSYHASVSSCNNRRCFKNSGRCDIRRDCSDGSDEWNCQQCNFDEFDCGRGVCISGDFVCNGYRHCSTGADEEGCFVCSSHQFRCRSTTSECVSLSRVCDSVLDCSDWSDEEGCATYRPYNSGYDPSSAGVGTVAGIVFACIAAIGLLIFCCVLIKKRRGLSRNRERRIRALAQPVVSGHLPAGNAPITINQYFDNRGFETDAPPSYQEFVAHPGDFRVPERTGKPEAPPSYEEYRKSLVKSSVQPPVLVRYTSLAETVTIGASRQGVQVIQQPGQGGLCQNEAIEARTQGDEYRRTPDQPCQSEPQDPQQSHNATERRNSQYQPIEYPRQQAQLELNRRGSHDTEPYDMGVFHSDTVERDLRVISGPVLTSADNVGIRDGETTNEPTRNGYENTTPDRYPADLPRSNHTRWPDRISETQDVEENNSRFGNGPSHTGDRERFVREGANEETQLQWNAHVQWQNSVSPDTEVTYI